MKRRTVTAGQPPAELLDYMLWCERQGHVWHEEGVYGMWCAAREAWSVANGWPGGDAIRAQEEVVVSTPDAPWDQSKI